MLQLYPLIFQPVFKERVWGGQRLSQFFPDLPAGHIGEAWVLSDHPQGRTPVINGALAGKTLGELITTYGAALVGRRGLPDQTGAFPLLFKLLDAQDDLSVQVHPADEYPGLAAGELGKSEMWVVLHAEPGAKVVFGLQAGITRSAFATAIAAGHIMTALREVETDAGDVFSVPAGTVHALAVPRYEEPPAVAKAAPSQPDVWQEICGSPFFVVAQGECSDQWAQETSPSTFEVVMILTGVGLVAWDDGVIAVHGGTTLLIPANLGAYRLQGNFRCLRVRIP